jgi:RimJ/RimL family protein N-acetyltransferase
MKAVLETTHLLLRPWQQEDLEPLVRLLATPEVARFLRLDGRTFTREETIQVHQRVLQSWNEQGLGAFAVIDKATGSWIGKLGLRCSYWRWWIIRSTSANSSRAGIFVRKESGQAISPWGKAPFDFF